MTLPPVHLCRPPLLTRQAVELEPQLLNLPWPIGAALRDMAGICPCCLPAAMAGAASQPSASGARGARGAWLLPGWAVVAWLAQDDYPAGELARSMRAAARRLDSPAALAALDAALAAALPEVPLDATQVRRREAGNRTMRFGTAAHVAGSFTELSSLLFVDRHVTGRPRCVQIPTSQHTLNK